MDPRHRLHLILVSSLLLGVALFAWSMKQSHSELQHLRDVLPQVYEPDGRSADLASDQKLMWETEPLSGQHGPSHGPDPHASTDRAIHASSRVFNSVVLVGKTRDEVIALLGDPRKSGNSIYNLPFWPPQDDALAYRFDTGMYGWQFNLVFDRDGIVSRVERQWIH